MTNREIKFRAWKKPAEEDEWGEGEMLYSRTEEFKRGAALVYLEDDDALYPDEYLWMQYTGLKDKNGVEIYEGDVVDGGNSGYNWIVEYGYFEDPHNLYVHNQINSGRKIESEYEELYFTSNGTDQIAIEVIGNIYENPELLK